MKKFTVRKSRQKKIGTQISIPHSGFIVKLLSWNYFPVRQRCSGLRGSGTDCELDRASGRVASTGIKGNVPEIAQNSSALDIGGIVLVAGVILFRRRVSQMDYGKQSRLVVEFWKEARGWDWSDRIEYLPRT